MSFALSAQMPFDAGHAGFSVTVNKMENPYRVLGLYLLPQQQVDIQASQDATIKAAVGEVEQRGNNLWRWRAPAGAGLYPIKIRNSAGALMTLNAFVMRPATDIKQDRLDEYPIGVYPHEPLSGLPVYLPPQGFIEITEDVLDTLVSPHFTLRQFLCKQTAAGTKHFMVLREALLLKLEAILQEVNRQGFRADSLFVMSGYRTPSYNHAIGNRPYSRHIYGGAADIFIDVSPQDGVMDDLNKDGKVDRKDAAFLYNMIENLSKNPDWLHIGGLGEYGATSTHGPFVHVDARGHRARWGSN